MAIAPVVWPLAQGVRTLFRFVPIGFALYEHFFQGDDPDPELEWRRLQVVFERTLEDDMICTFDLLNITDEAIDTSWTTEDYEEAEAAFETFLGTYAAFLAENHGVKEYRWYRGAFQDIGASEPFAPAIVPERIQPSTINGSGATSFPSQLSCVITELTGLPRHSGRFYLPYTGNDGIFTQSGQLSQANVDAILAAAEFLYETLHEAQLHPVVPVTQVNNSPARALTSVIALKADTIVDIQRRRRPEAATYTSTVALS